MPQMSILHVSFHGFDYSKALYVSHRHLVGFIIAVAAILVLIAFILHSPSRIKSSFFVFFVPASSSVLFAISLGLPSMAAHTKTFKNCFKILLGSFQNHAINTNIAATAITLG